MVGVTIVDEMKLRYDGAGRAEFAHFSAVEDSRDTAQRDRGGIIGGQLLSVTLRQICW